MDAGHRGLLERQGYGLVGEHSAVKLCHWLRQKLVKGRPCYKETFYGISSHRCLQMTPWLGCNQGCLFCWRYPGDDPVVDEPMEAVALLEGAIDTQRRLVSGYRGVETVDDGMWHEARDPDQMAISLAGEPTMYPLLGDLVAAARERGITTFLVSNGTLPDRLAAIDPLPTQVYVSVDAPNREVFSRLCRPSSDALWGRLQDGLGVLHDLDTRTVIRHTLVNGYNMVDVDGYARQVSLAEPDYVEAKGYVFVGHSRQVLSIDCMPSIDQVREFAEALAGGTGYVVTAEKADSRVVLLTKDGKLPGVSRPLRDGPGGSGEGAESP
ncbi:MAG: 4-demethylwyosine synthase TYW1 [Thermoplasmata archaeon]|nr:4-demethylwyosine synthase TYW1 [Thermoplasmata archaeon]